MLRPDKGTGLVAETWNPGLMGRARTEAAAPPFLATEMPRHEATVARSFTLAGRALHCGRRGAVTVAPRRAGGIVFRRGDRRVAATWEHRVPQVLANAVRFPDGRIVRLIEHLLATLAAYGIDHAEIGLEGDELPIFDGSALPWCQAIEAAGAETLGAPRTAIRVLKPVEVRESCRHLRIEPAEALSLDVRIALHRMGPLRWAGAVTPASFRRDLAPSRSFGRLRWALPALAWGFAKRRPVLRGAWPGTTAVLWGDRVLGGMRVPEEPVRHRALDLVGDLALAGRPLIGHVTAVNPGHDINSALVSALMADPGAWELATL